MCQNAEKIARDAPVTTRQHDMNDARKRMVVELSTGAISTQKLPNAQQLPYMPKVGKKTSKIKKRQAAKHDTRTVVEAKGVKIEAKKDEENKRRPQPARIKWPKSNSKEWNVLD